MSKRKASPAPGTQEMAIDLEQNDLLPVPIAEEPPKRLRLDDDMEDQFVCFGDHRCLITDPAEVARLLEGEDWIGCDGCTRYFHKGVCVTLEYTEQFICVFCKGN